MKRQNRLLELLRFTDRTPAEILELGMLNGETVSHLPDGRFRVGVGMDAEFFPTYSRAYREKIRRVVNRAMHEMGGLKTFTPELGTTVPRSTRVVIEQSLRKRAGKPRGGWKWDEASRRKLSESRKAAPKGPPRQRGYPLYSIGDPIPETGHRFTVTRETLERLILPEGM